jgi:hypothetical protein
MKPAELQFQLDSLIAGWEGECVEFKVANDNYYTPDIGKYFSALSNEANLHSRDAGWLVFGVDNKTRKIIGTDYRQDRERLHSLKHQIAQNTDQRSPRSPSAKSTNLKQRGAGSSCLKFPRRRAAFRLPGTATTMLGKEKASVPSISPSWMKSVVKARPKTGPPSSAPAQRSPISTPKPLPGRARFSLPGTATVFRLKPSAPGTTRPSSIRPG